MPADRTKADGSTMTQHGTLTDRDILRDCLVSSKYVAAMFNHAANECDSDKVRDVMLRCLEDSHELQRAVFNLMHQKGWYQTLPAEAATLREAQAHSAEAYRRLQQMQDASPGEV